MFPLARDDALLPLRRFLGKCYAGIPLEAEPDLRLIGVQSCKVSLLSHEKQLDPPEDPHRQPGHHLQSSFGMVELCSRDDV